MLEHDRRTERILLMTADSEKHLESDAQCSVSVMLRIEHDMGVARDQHRPRHILAAADVV